MFKFLVRPSLLFSKRTTKLKKLIQSKELEFIMEAHNGLSALIVQEAGFKGIWASGLSMSAQLGVRDCNEASWTQLLEVLEFMAERTTIPILMDGDTGFGNYNNARRLVRKLEERGIGGVCFEDKIFPKRNSLGEGAQELANVKEFQNKIKACKDFQRDQDFQIVARCESFIAGWGLDNALERCEAYRNAGVDAVLIHSKKSDFTEIESFLKSWNNRLPVVIVPTNYYTTPTEEFRKLNVSLAIWANHNLRASIKAMQETSKQIFERQNLNGLDNIASVKEVFRLQNEKGLEQDDKKYL
ncbi:unnamed protein product [Paramecium sonneborni]|uniref:Phosphoenolpyruvate mutase n=1 Tax=Paramecium sonneborni TaxID=65129 RepID=A0A8S1NS07_9CILI|nr:unnamed protein product [Paramecium sonneborni]